jgi:hypothetical protein
MILRILNQMKKNSKRKNKKKLRLLNNSKFINKSHSLKRRKRLEIILNKIDQLRKRRLKNQNLKNSMKKNTLRSLR